MKNLILIALSILIIGQGCKKEELVEHKIVVKEEIPIVVEKPSDKFIGDWVNGSICGSSTNVLITEGGSDSTIYLYGSILATITNGKFYGRSSTVNHTGEIIDGKLKYCQSTSIVNCCGVFSK